MGTLDHGLLDRMESGGVRFHQATQNDMQFKTSQTVYLWNFPFNIFIPQSTVGSKLQNARP